MVRGLVVIRWSIGVLVALWVVLPVRLPHSADGPSTAECLTISDTVPESGNAHLDRIVEGCLATSPTDADLWASAAQLRESSGRMVEAEAAYKRTLQLNPGNSDVRMRFARLLLKRGDAAGAREQALAASRLQPNRKAVLDFVDAIGSEGNRSPVSQARVHNDTGNDVSGRGH
jgi:hypothetical protein